MKVSAPRYSLVQALFAGHEWTECLHESTYATGGTKGAESVDAYGQEARAGRMHSRPRGIDQQAAHNSEAHTTRCPDGTGDMQCHVQCMKRQQSIGQTGTHAIFGARLETEA